MRKSLTTSLSMASVLFAFSVAQAGDVKVAGVHLCCGQCVKIVGKTLKGVKGVTDVVCDRTAKPKTVSFTAADDKAAKAGVAALAKAGFHGAAAHGDKKLAFPKSGAKKGAKADAVTLNGVHLCCGQCVKAIGKLFKEFDGVSSVKCDRKGRTVVLIGSDIDVSAAVAALNKTGFHGTIKKK